jgi:hypothetical protein
MWSDAKFLGTPLAPRRGGQAMVPTGFLHELNEATNSAKRVRRPAQLLDGFNAVATARKEVTCSSKHSGLNAETQASWSYIVQTRKDFADASNINISMDATKAGTTGHVMTFFASNNDTDVATVCPPRDIPTNFCFSGCVASLTLLSMPSSKHMLGGCPAIFRGGRTLV